MTCNAFTFTVEEIRTKIEGNFPERPIKSLRHYFLEYHLTANISAAFSRKLKVIASYSSVGQIILLSRIVFDFTSSRKKLARRYLSEKLKKRKAMNRACLSRL